MRPVVLMITAMIIACYPRIAFSQAKINGGNNVTVYAGVRSWETYYIFLPSIGPTNYSMDDFVDDEEYKIVVVEDAPNMVTDLQMYIAEYFPNDGITQYTPLPSDFEFPFNPNYSLRIQFKIPSTATIGQTQLLKFQIYRKRPLNIWDWQSSFFVYVNTTCPTNQTFGSLTTLSGIDYEVGGNLIVACTAYPAGGITELDAGQSVTLNPGFVSNLGGGGAVLAIIDGCGGAYRMANNSGADEKETLEKAIPKKDVMVYPNPTSDKCYLEFPNDVIGKELNVTIMDVKGRLLYSHTEVYGDTAQVDLSQFDTGMYFIHISGEGINYNQKIIKQ